MDKDLLLKPSLDEDTVDVPGKGPVRVRALSRWEILYDVQKAKGAVGFEIRLLTLGLVDPAMSEDDVKAWMRAAKAGDIDPVVERIGELSGLGGGDDQAQKEAAKAIYESFRDES